MSRFIRALLFDLGGTLMQSVGEWEPVKQEADKALVTALRDYGLQIPDQFAAVFRSRLGHYYQERDKKLFETTYFSVLRELLKEFDHVDIPEKMIRGGLEALYSITQANWELDRDTMLTLRMLESAGYRLGLVSNAGDHQDVLTLAARFRIDRFFDFILTSASCSYRKPHPRIFELALQHWGFRPEEASMIGDSLEADIQGAQNSGIFSIWYTAHAKHSGVKSQILPDASIDSLLDIPKVLAGAD